MHTDTTPPSMTVPRSLKGFVTVVTLTPTEPKLSILTAFENVIRKSVARLTFCLSSGLTSWSTLCLESERSSAPAGPNANLPVRTGGPAHFAMYDRVYGLEVKHSTFYSEVLGLIPGKFLHVFASLANCLNCSHLVCTRCCTWYFTGCSQGQLTKK